MKRKKLYISLPISGRNLDDVRKRAEHLKKSVEGDIDVVTPFDVCPDSTLPYNELMGRDVAELLTCDYILLDWDWRESKGCRTEKAIAEIYRIPSYTIAKDNDKMIELTDHTEFQVTMNLRQLRLLSEMCDNHSRIICGQLLTGLMPYIKSGIRKEHPEWDWSMIDEQVEAAMAIINQLTKLVWNMENGASHGVKYDDRADVLFDMHQVIRHHLWLERPEPKPHHINSASDAFMFGGEPKIRITTLKGKDNG